ncbi:exo-alpha-sialidase [Desertivirga arenae]|uniref:exo-alpha-sialidase n=1 Tax=Desertivirga arenae TaxID=2810309 RepID=UPI001A96FAB1|nr:exo-alpha-sialidase [Pedobacter sp. SYSU D00823]
MNLVNRIGLSLGLAAAFVAANAQDTVRYTGTTLSNVDYHHGQLSPAVGVHSIQVFRANRQHPELADGFSWTYNHAPMIAHWNNTFYLEYLSDPVGEHIPPSQSLLHTSKDGYNWSKPVVIFPVVKVPDGWKKEGYPGVAKDLYAVMHQRMGFFTSKKNRLLVLAYYGIAMDQKDDPNDGKGMGRAVREIKKDGSFGPIYFIRYNSSWDKSKSEFPFYTKSKDKGFVEACNELLATPLMMQQWVEEADRNDPLIPLKKEVKAFSYYHLPDGRVVGLWKNALTSISKDNGKTWEYNPTRAPKFVNSNAKIWGQKTSDGKYATVYNPSEFRWPLAISVSQDGLNYNNLLLVNGEISPMRYGGNYKSYGPQYVRGMEEGNGSPSDGKLWLTYSMNKEDIWVSSVPVPVTDKVTTYPNEVFAQMPAGKELDLWNTYSPKWAPVSISKMNDGAKALLLSDKDRYEYAKAERVVPSGKRLIAEITVVPQQNNKGQLDIEFLDSKGTPAIRLQFDSTANFTTKAGYRNRNVIQYKAGESYTIKVDLDTDRRFYNLDINGKKMPGIFFAPVAEISRISFRTGDTRRFPDADTPTDPMHESLPQAGDPADGASFFIKSLVTKGN